MEPAVSRRRGAAAFGVMTCIIGAVSVHDAVLIVHNRFVIAEFERNPIGRWLIEAQQGDVSLFVAAKLCGSALVCAVLITLYQFRPKIAVAVAGVITCLQLGLLVYLSMK